MLLGAFFTAARLLSHSMDNFYIRTSVRADVWTSIAREDEALDKCVQDITDIKWPRSGTRKIIGSRLRNYVREYDTDLATKTKFLDLSDADLINCIFDTHFELGAGLAPNSVVIHRLASGRPR